MKQGYTRCWNCKGTGYENEGLYPGDDMDVKCGYCDGSGELPISGPKEPEVGEKEEPSD